jgi:TonB family protein
MKHYIRAVAAVTFWEEVEKPTTTTTATTTSKKWAGLITSGPYKVGSYFNNGQKEGVVFWIDKSGKQGKILSLTESSNCLKWTIDAADQKRLIGADDYSNGANNMAKVMQIENWQNKYPAFKWCADLGEGWYLPAPFELEEFMKDVMVREAVNKTLAFRRGRSVSNSCWSSKECGESYVWAIPVVGSSIYANKRDYATYVRAVAAVSFEEAPTTTATTSANIVSSSSAQASDEIAFVKVEVMPTFQGGDLMTFRKWVQGQLKYPAEALENGIAGRVYFTFVVERDGSVSNVNIIQSPHQSLSNEVIRAVLSSPKWEPGKQRGQAVRVKLTMSADFKL